MTDQSTPDPNRFDNPRAEENRKTTPIKSGLANDPDYLKLLELYQNGEFKRCQNFVNELERRYPGHPDVKKIKEDLEFKLTLSQMNAKNRSAEKRQKVKATLKLVVFGILGVVVVATALFISFSHFSGQVAVDEYAQQTAQANSLKKLSAQAEELLLFGQPQPALEIIDRIKAIDPTIENLAVMEARAEYLITLEAKYQKGVDFQNEGKLDEALLVFTEIEGEEAGLWDISQRINQIMNTMDVESLLIEGNNAYQAGNWEKVISSYETAMLLDSSVGNQTIDDQLVQAYLNKIINMMQNETTSVEDIEDAEQYFRKVIALIPQNANYSDERGNLQELSTQLLKVKYAQTANAMLADKMQTTSSISKAVSYLTKAVNYDPSDSDLQEDLKNAKYYEAAFQQFIDMNWESSISNLNAIMSSDLTFAGGNANFLLYEAYYFLGEQYYFARVYEDALEILEQAEIVVWNDTDNLFRLFKLQKLLGDVYVQLDNYENAASYYQYALYAINFGTRLTRYPDITVKYVEAVNAFEDGEYRNAYRGFAEIFEEIDFIYQMENIEIEKGVCLALIAGEYHSTVAAIIDANNLPNSMVTTAKQTLIIPTITE